MRGVSILDAVHEAGYFDQSHLTRSLKHFIGLTPAQIIDEARAVPLSFLYKTAPIFELKIRMLQHLGVTPHAIGYANGPGLEDDDVGRAHRQHARCAVPFL